MKSLSIYSERRRAAAGLLRLIGAALLLSLVSVGCAASLPTATLQIGSQTLTVEVAHTPKQRERGLMFRKNMPLDHGMLFVFPRDEQLSFWMKNTRIPLSIAFIASDGTIKQIADMQPESLATVPSDYSVRYALEVNQGYFARHEIRAGDRVALPADIPTATQ